MKKTVKNDTGQNLYSFIKMDNLTSYHHKNEQSKSSKIVKY